MRGGTNNQKPSFPSFPSLPFPSLPFPSLIAHPHDTSRYLRRSIQFDSISTTGQATTTRQGNIHSYVGVVVSSALDPFYFASFHYIPERPSSAVKLLT